MPARRPRGRGAGQAMRLLGATALSCLFAADVVAPSYAQSTDVIRSEFGDEVAQDGQMLLEADTLVYDQDRNTVSAVGGVKIVYNGNRLFAQRVTYDRNTGRMVASGNVEIIETDGNRIYAQEVDITDDFANGFVNALRVESADETYFAAESARREGGSVTTFNNGIYTACEPCEEDPDRAPIWRVKGRTIIWDGEARTVRFEHARLEFFGVPLAYLPVFEVPDPTVKRKSGFLVPSIGYTSNLGFSTRVPYYFALSPTFDLTVAASGYTKQGFLGEAEWRQRFNSGEYNLKIAGIHQFSPNAFPAGQLDRGLRNRGMVGTKGEFRINPRWTFGWNVLVQSDKNFSNRYRIEGFNEYVHRSEIYLTGLHDRNYFDLSAYRFQVQEPLPSSNVRSRSERQPWVLPSFDYSYTPDQPVLGGELNIDVNAQGIHRRRLSPDSTLIGPGSNISGLQGTSGRITAEAEWKRSFIAPGGLVLTPLLHGRSDGIFTNLSPASVAAIGRTGMPADIRAAYYRYMATAGLEARWPILFSTTSSTHVLEPMGQVFARPDEPFGASVGIPNEDAQSFVFDATTLFERDKFSGYDRIEGGTRANVGIRYSGAFGNGWSLTGIAGQSYQLAGRNSFASPDLVSAGAQSGLETSASDYVGLVGISAPFGLSASVGARFDERNFTWRRTDVTAAYTPPSGRLDLFGKYTFIQAQPQYGFPTDRHEATLGASVRVHRNWRVFGSGTYDFQSGVLVSNSIGFSYDDECFTYLMALNDTRNRTTRALKRNISFTVKLRTLGEFGTDNAAGLFAN